MIGMSSQPAAALQLLAARSLSLRGIIEWGESAGGLCPVDVLEGESRLLAGLCGDDWDVLASSCLAAVGCEIPTSAGHHQESKICRRTLSCGFS